VVTVQQLDVVEHRACRCHLGVVGAGRVQALVGHVVVEEVTLVGQLGEQTGAHHHQPLVHRVRLVEAEEVDVGADRGDVGKAVRSERHAVDDHASPDGVCERRDPGDVVLGADDVRRVRHGDQTRAFAEQRFELGRCRAARSRGRCATP
jgi:hypothetical protein